MHTLPEYEEIVKAKYSPSIAHDFLIALKELPNVYFTQVFYQWQLLKDEDVNKVSDCYVAANAEYLLTHNSGFKILKSISLPPINVVSFSIRIIIKLLNFRQRRDLSYCYQQSTTYP